MQAKNNKRKAEAILNAFLEQYAFLEELPATCNTIIDPNITLTEYLSRWLVGKKRELALSTYESYAYRVGSITNYFKISDPKLINITPQTMDAFFKYSLDQGKINQKTKEREPLSVRSVRSYKSILNAVFKQAMIDGVVKSNPVDHLTVSGKKNRDYNEEMLFLTETEISDFLHFLRDNFPRLLGIAFMGVYYGLRRSEILGLKWSAIDFDKKIIHICDTVVRVKTTQAKHSTKTPAGRRNLNLFETAENCLLLIKQEQANNKAFFKGDYKNKDGYVFTWEDGTPYRPDYISSTFKKAATAFGRPEITLHKLRHTCASLLINKGWDVKRLQYWLGQTDTQTTLNIYAHFDKHRLNAGENDLSQIALAAADLFEEHFG